MKLFLATAIMILVAKGIYLSLSKIIGLRLGLLIAIALGGIVYFLLLVVFRVKEVEELKESLLKKRNK